MMRIIGIMHALWLHHIDLPHKLSIKKGIIYIKSMNAPLKVECNDKHNTDGDWINHGTESLVKVNALLLVKAFSNKASFISCNRVVKILLNTKHPFVAHYILPRARGNESPSTVLDKSIIFFLHRRNPLVIPKSLGNNAGCSEKWNYGGEAIFRFRFDDGIFSSGLHGMTF